MSDDANSVLIICEQCVSCSPALRELGRSGVQVTIAHTTQDAFRLLATGSVRRTVVHDDPIGSGSIIATELKALFPGIEVLVERAACASDISARYGMEAVGNAATLDEAGHSMGMFFLHQQSKQPQLGHDPFRNDDPQKLLMEWKDAKVVGLAHRSKAAS